MLKRNEARKFIGSRYVELDTPALLVNLDAYERNVRLMMRRLAGAGAKLRPHFKTHKCAAVAKEQIRHGAIGITCAKLDECEILAGAGVKSILIANQVVGRMKAERLAVLSKRSEVIVCVDNLKNVKELAEAAARAKTRIHVLIEVDIGMKRCGIRPAEAVRFARAITRRKSLVLRGLMGYEGHLVYEKNARRKERETKKSIGMLLNANKRLEKAGFAVEIVSAGGTGTAHITSQIPGVTEIQAGSYAFMDLKYASLKLGYDIAISVLSTVMSVSAKGKAIVDCGRKALPIDQGLPAVKGRRNFRIMKLNEEHGHVRLPAGKKLRLGQKIQLIPGHCCSTFNAHDVAFGIRKGSVERVFTIGARGGYR
jgi:D-serine deaminase-like pyridoxal phosphate-dependent protein